MTDYKNSINLPKTNFKMKANLIKNEPEIIKKWHEENLYETIRNVKKNKKIFILHDGPPYANGPIHMGHAINKVLKDIIIKYKNLVGYDAPYIPGWDCHGLPIELKVEQLLGKSNKYKNINKFNTYCYKYAISQVKKQKQEFIRLGIIGDWNNSYLTIHNSIEANTIKLFAKIVNNNYLYKGKKPVNWCIECCSTLAEAEIEYNSHTSESIYVKFKIMNNDIINELLDNKYYNNYSTFLLIWTTNPWTLLANQAIAINPNLKYIIVNINNHINIIIAEKLLTRLIVVMNITNYKILCFINSDQLLKLKSKHPFLPLLVVIISSNHVKHDMGTGLVHIAPGHGMDDYVLGKKYNLKIINVLDKHGQYCIKNILPELYGLQWLILNNKIIKLLIKYNNLFYKENIIHNYPYCWRHKIPTIFRTTEQWFINMNKNNLRQQLIKQVKHIKWTPYFNFKNIQDMIINRPDWCISRQRTWGVPIPLFIHKKTGSLHPNTVYLIHRIVKLVKKHGIRIWWNLDIKSFLGKDASMYNKVNDVLDVWFDSGSTFYSVLKYRKDFRGHSISNLCLEGLDQCRGWFMSSLILSTIVQQKSSYQEVLTHGFAVDYHGNKMSKSDGNIISPKQIINKFGADVLRLWIASTNFSNDMNISLEIIKQSSDNYRRIRNTVRFLLSNLNKFNPKTDIVKYQDMIAIDKWIIGQTYKTQINIVHEYNNYHFHNVVKQILYFCSIKMSSLYLEIIKDRQYITKYNSIPYRSCQTALFHISEAIVRWLAPIISFTADEIWQFLPGDRSNSIFTEELYDKLVPLNNNNLLNNRFWKKIILIRNEVNKVIEQAKINKIINNSLEANIILYVESKLLKELNKLNNELKFVFIVSKILVFPYHKADHNAIKSKNINKLKINIFRSKDKKCQRCWHYDSSVGLSIMYPSICSRCIININENGEVRKFV
ncbi:MAG: isoleucine--tRNA ligase [Candidatus Lightella neohaematopini]|nr:isoleucine--tRNA ligase [Candidatus Lightella neohaematopini]